MEIKDIENRILNADCMDILKQLPDKCIDLVCTDCPYHICSGGCTTGAYGNKTNEPSGIFNKRKDEHGNVYMSNTKHVSLCGMLNDYDPTTYTKQGKLFKHNDIKFKEWLPEIYRVLKDNTHCYIMINARNLCELQTECENVGFVFQQLLIWDKGNATPNKYYLNAFECILMLRKGNAKNINNMGTKNILKVPNIIGGKKHPTEKPVSLMQVLIENSTKEGEIVLDPFAGSSPVAVACTKSNRKYICIELDEKYYEASVKRLEDEQRQGVLF